MNEDPIVAEVRKTREEIFARFGYDLKSYIDHLRKTQPAAGQKYVVRSSRASRQQLAESKTQ